MMADLPTLLRSARHTPAKKGRSHCKRWLYATKRTKCAVYFTENTIHCRVFSFCFSDVICEIFLYMEYCLQNYSACSNKYPYNHL